MDTDAFECAPLSTAQDNPLKRRFNGEQLSGLHAEKSFKRANCSSTSRKRRKLSSYPPLRSTGHPFENASLPPVPTHDIALLHLTRVIATTLAAVGFQSAQTSALEYFRSIVESYISRLLSWVTTSMLSCRRTNPIPQDFAVALYRAQLTSTLLEPCVNYSVKFGKLPNTYSHNSTSQSDPYLEYFLLPDNSLINMLSDSCSPSTPRQKRSYIPSHIPNLPSDHTWKASPVYSRSFRDPSKIREQSTKEGVLAEQSLRKLMAARQRGNAPSKSFTQTSPSVLINSSLKSPISSTVLHPRAKIETTWKSAMQTLTEENRKIENLRRKRYVNNESPKSDAHNELLDSTINSNIHLALNSMITLPCPEYDSIMTVNHGRKYWRLRVAEL